VRQARSLAFMGLESYVHRRTQQGREMVPSFNLWRSFSKASSEEMSKQGSGNILLSSASSQ
jgi:hypothetical protein